MSHDFLTFSLIAGLGGAATLAFILGACRVADNGDRRAKRIMRDLEAESERVIHHGDQHPWVKP